MMADKTIFGFAYAIALGWSDTKTPCIPFMIDGPKGGSRGSGDFSIDEARKFRDRLNEAIAEAEKAGL